MAAEYFFVSLDNPGLGGFANDINNRRLAGRWHRGGFHGKKLFWSWSGFNQA